MIKYPPVVQITSLLASGDNRQRIKPKKRYEVKIIFDNRGMKRLAWCVENFLISKIILCV